MLESKFPMSARVTPKDSLGIFLPYLKVLNLLSPQGISYFNDLLDWPVKLLLKWCNFVKMTLFAFKKLF